jgi:hypothetical protein
MMYGMYLEVRPGRDERGDRITALTRVTITPVDGPPVDLSAYSAYLTETPGNRVAFVEVADLEGFSRLRTGQVVRLEVVEGPSVGSEEVIARHVIERGAIDVMSRKGVVGEVIKSIIVVTEIGRGGRDRG